MWHEWSVTWISIVLRVEGNISEILNLASQNSSLEVPDSPE